jgi:hypothetical protein
VGAFEFMRQIDKHPDGGDGVLGNPRFVAALDGEPQVAHTDFVDAQLAVMPFTLFIVQNAQFITGFQHRQLGVYARTANPQGDSARQKRSGVDRETT